MEIKLLKDVKGFRRGSEHEARYLKQSIIDIRPSFQIIKGPLSGEVIPYENCVLVEATEITYTEKQWNDMKNHYLKLLETEQKISREAYSENNKLNVELRNTRGLVRRLTERLMVTDFSHMLNDWLESEYEVTEAEDRNNFAKKIVSYLSNVQQI